MMTTADSIAVLRQYLADKPSLAPRLRDALEQVQEAVEEAERVIGPFASEAFRYEPDEGDAGFGAWNSTLRIGHLRAAAEWKRKYGRRER